jgi:hypothetical protein
VDEDDMVKDYREEQLDATLDKWMDDMESWIPGAAGSR